jgi:acyl-[acyl carrier protein]--UDP-N-acetylglucosamine O-acyltransferase
MKCPPISLSQAMLQHCLSMLLNQSYLIAATAYVCNTRVEVSTQDSSRNYIIRITFNIPTIKGRNCTSIVNDAALFDCLALYCHMANSCHAINRMTACNFRSVAIGHRSISGPDTSCMSKTYQL